MPDNIQLNPGYFGALINTEDLGGGVQLSRCKAVLGVSNVDDGDVSSTNPMPVAYPGTHEAICGTVTLVPSNTETTVTTYTVPVSETLKVAGFVATGDINAQYNLYINGVLTAASRSSVATPNAELFLQWVTPSVLAGQTVQIKVIHFATGKHGSFVATLLGYQVP
jgi:hypothetical protein